jgi:hypothetical protein
VFVSSVVGFVLTLTVIRFTDQTGWNADAAVVDLSDTPNSLVYLYINNGMVETSLSILPDIDTDSYIGEQEFEEFDFFKTHFVGKKK